MQLTGCNQSKCFDSDETATIIEPNQVSDI